MEATRLGLGKVRYGSIRASNFKWALLEQADGYVHLYTVEGTFVRVLPQALRTDTEIVFDWTDSNHVYYIGKNNLYRMSLLDDKVELVETFEEFVRFTAEHAEGDLTETGYLALGGVKEDGTEWVLTYNVLTKMKSVAWNQKSFDGRKVTSRGFMLISRETGIFALVGSDWKQLTEVNGHACPATYEGSDVLLWCTNARVRGWANNLEMVDVLDPSKTRVLFDLERKDYAMQISASSSAAYMSLYASTTLPNQLWEVPFNGAKPQLLYEWTSIYRDYDSSPKASFSEGRLLFNVDDGRTIDVWKIDLAKPAVPVPLLGTRVDYSSYVGKKYWEMWPRSDGGLDIIERLLK